MTVSGVMYRPTESSGYPRSAAVILRSAGLSPARARVAILAGASPMRRARSSGSISSRMSWKSVPRSPSRMACCWPGSSSSKTSSSRSLSRSRKGTIASRPGMRASSSAISWGLCSANQSLIPVRSLFSTRSVSSSARSPSMRSTPLRLHRPAGTPAGPRNLGSPGPFGRTWSGPSSLVWWAVRASAPRGRRGRARRSGDGYEEPRTGVGEHVDPTARNGGAAHPLPVAERLGVRCARGPRGRSRRSCPC